MTAGPRGPQLLQDVWFLEKLAHFDREVIPERRMHAKGSGAYGTFTVTHDITRFTRAKLFSEIGKKTEMFVRFPPWPVSAARPMPSATSRGFAMKFYTEEGNWDLVGNNTPVFFLRDPLKFPDLNHAVKRNPRTNLRSATQQLGFLDAAARGAAPGHGGHVRPGHSGQLPPHARFWLAHLQLHQCAERAFLGQIPLQNPAGHQKLNDEEAAAAVANDRETHQRDLYEAIERGDFPKWTMYVQIMPELEAEKVPLPPVRPDQGLAQGRTTR